MELTPIGEEFLQWQKDNGKFKHELTDIYVEYNGEIKKDKMMVWVSHYTYDDWKEFCKVTGKTPEEAKILAIY